MKSLVESILSSTATGSEYMINQLFVSKIPGWIKQQKKIELDFSSASSEPENLLLLLKIPSIPQKYSWDKEIEKFIEKIKENIRNDKELRKVFFIVKNTSTFDNLVMTTYDCGSEKDNSEVFHITHVYYFEDKDSKPHNSFLFSIPKKYISDISEFIKQLKK